MKFLIKLNTIEKIKTFVDKVSRYDLDVDLISGRYTIDAKSIMGIFSLNLSVPIEIIFHIEDRKNATELASKIDLDFEEYKVTA